jgi:hypothetical protein
MAVLDKYYNRFDPAKKYTKTLFLASRGLQSAELNEIQEYSGEAIREVGDALFSNGMIISGCTCIIDAETVAVTVEAGKIYIDGLIREINEGTFSIPTDTSVKIGVYYKEQIVTELEDETLRDPAVGTRNFQEVGAIRNQYVLTWGYQLEASGESDASLGEFYSIYNVENGVLLQGTVAPQMNSVSNELVRYDNESNGSYVVNGMEVTCLSADSESQTFSVNEGKAHVNGEEIELNYALRSVFSNDCDIQEIESDPYVFEPNGLGQMTINLTYTPVAEIESVDVTAEKTETLTHGNYSGALDPIPETSILEIMKVKQGNTTYVKGTDYKLTSGKVDWSLSGAEPSPGSSYEITYRYRTQITPIDVTDTSVTISGAVSGTMVLINYTWKMPRYDLITIDAEGIIRRIKRLAHPWSPSVPKAPSGQLVLAQIYQNWLSDSLPTVTDKAVRVTTMADIESMKSMINDLYYLVAQQNLKIDANASDPSTKKGVFVDPFYDDDMRDQGIAQTGAIVDESLQLPLTITPKDFSKDSDLILPYTLEAMITQETRTGHMKVNPYMAFDPIPADVTLNSNVDNWTEFETRWLSPETQYFRTYSNRWFSGTITYKTTEENVLVSKTTTAKQYMRQATQQFTVEGLKPGERINKILFNGVNITSTNTGA